MAEDEKTVSSDQIKRRIVAFTVGAVLLLVFLVSFMAYQLLAIKYEKKREAELESKIAEYEQLIAEGKDTLEVRSLRWWIEVRARELGYSYDGEVDLNK